MSSKKFSATVLLCASSQGRAMWPHALRNDPSAAAGFVEIGFIFASFARSC
jgi:hypothetical protein